MASSSWGANVPPKPTLANSWADRGLYAETERGVCQQRRRQAADGQMLSVRAPAAQRGRRAHKYGLDLC